MAVLALCSLASNPLDAKAEIVTVASEEKVSIDAHGVCRSIKNGGTSSIMVPTFSANEWSAGANAFLQNIQGMDLVTADPCQNGKFAYLSPCGVGRSSCLWWDSWNFRQVIFIDNDIYSVCGPGKYEERFTIVPLNPSNYDSVYRWSYNTQIDDMWMWPIEYKDMWWDAIYKTTSCNLWGEYSNSSTNYDQQYVNNQVSDLRFALNDPNFHLHRGDYLANVTYDRSNNVEWFIYDLSPATPITADDYVGYYCIGGSAATNKGCLNGQSYNQNGYGNIDPINATAGSSSPIQCIYYMNNGYKHTISAPYTFPVPYWPRTVMQRLVRNNHGGVAPNSDGILQIMENPDPNMVFMPDGHDSCRIITTVKNSSGDEVYIFALYEQ